MSARTGVSFSTEIVTSDCLGSFGSSDKSVTSPTRMPLKVTDAPRAQAADRALEHDAIVRALAGAADMVEPVDEAERAHDHREREQPIRM